MIGIACTIFLLIQFLKGAFPEGAGSLLAIVFYCVLSLMSVGFMLLTHAHILISSVILTGALLLVSLAYFVVKVGFPKR